MLKVKVFIFNISNYNTNYEFERGGVADRGTQEKYRAKEEEIEKTINEFTKDKEVLDIKVETATVLRHNNARCDTVNLYYTIQYKD